MFQDYSPFQLHLLRVIEKGGAPLREAFGNIRKDENSLSCGARIARAFGWEEARLPTEGILSNEEMEIQFTHLMETRGISNRELFPEAAEHSPGSAKHKVN